MEFQPYFPALFNNFIDVSSDHSFLIHFCPNNENLPFEIFCSTKKNILNKLKPVFFWTKTGLNSRAPLCLLCFQHFLVSQLFESYSVIFLFQLR